MENIVLIALTALTYSQQQIIIFYSKRSEIVFKFFKTYWISETRVLDRDQFCGIWYLVKVPNVDEWFSYM